jgi:hypothetical protein
LVNIDIQDQVLILLSQLKTYSSEKVVTEEWEHTSIAFKTKFILILYKRYYVNEENGDSMRLEFVFNYCIG